MIHLSTSLLGAGRKGWGFGYVVKDFDYKERRRTGVKGKVEKDEEEEEEGLFSVKPNPRSHHHPLKQRGCRPQSPTSQSPCLLRLLCVTHVSDGKSEREIEGGEGKMSSPTLP